MIDTVFQLLALVLFIAALATAPLWGQLFLGSLILGTIGIALETRKG